MRKLVFVDPHISDFVYRPVAFWLAKKRALVKYAYLAELNWAGLYATGKATSLPSAWNEWFPAWLLSVLTWAECSVWLKLNPNVNASMTADLTDCDVFLFGYKNTNARLNHLIGMNFKGKVFVHLSHYHTFSIPSEAFDKLDIELCFDNDASNMEFFRRKFPTFDRKLHVLPFAVSDRFLEPSNAQRRRLRVLATGTFHRLPKGSIGISFGEFDTLHPDRLEFSSIEPKPASVLDMTSRYKSDASFVSKWMSGQKKYFKINIVEAYQSASHAFVASEGTGAIAIGMLEAMACGCLVFCRTGTLNGVLFDTSKTEILYYDDVKHLLKLIQDLEDKDYFRSTANIEAASKYSSNNLLLNALEVFCA